MTVVKDGKLGIIPSLTMSETTYGRRCPRELCRFLRRKTETIELSVRDEPVGTDTKCQVYVSGVLNALYERSPLR